MRDLAKFQRAAAAEPSALRRALLSMVAGTEANPAAFLSQSDEDLALLAAKAFVDQLKDHQDHLREHITSTEKLQADVERAMRNERQAHADARDKLVEEIRALKKEIDPDEIKLRILYAVDEACAAKDAQIADSFGWSSTNGVHQQLVALEKKGLARHRPRCARGWLAVQP